MIDTGRRFFVFLFWFFLYQVCSRNLQVHKAKAYCRVRTLIVVNELAMVYTCAHTLICNRLNCIRMWKRKSLSLYICWHPRRDCHRITCSQYLFLFAPLGSCSESNKLHFPWAFKWSRTQSTLRSQSKHLQLWIRKKELTQKDGWNTQDGRMTKKVSARDCAFPIWRDIFSSFCRPECSSRPVA